MAAFEAAGAELRAAGVAVAAASTDPRERAEATVAALGLRFPVGYGLPLEDTAARLGAFYEVRRGILHATGLVVRPDGAIGVVVYSAGAIGRLVPDEVRRQVDFWRRPTG